MVTKASATSAFRDRQREAAPHQSACPKARRGRRHHRYHTDNLFGRCLLRFTEVRLDLAPDAHVPRKRFTNAGIGE